MKPRKICIVVAVVMGGAAGPSAGTVDMSFTHSYREFVDRGNVTVNIRPHGPPALDCAVPVAVAQAGKHITLSARQAAPGQVNPEPCAAAAKVLSPLAAGDYEITAQVISAAGVTVESATQALQILPIEGRCNADPVISPSLLALHETLPPAQLASLLATDPAYASRLGNPTILNPEVLENRTYARIVYSPLVDPTVEFDRLLASGEFSDVWRNGRVCFATSPPDATAQFVEFYHAGLDHFFYSGNAAEIAAIEAGQVGPGWARTGKSFRAVMVPGCYFSTTDTVVYRFFGLPGIGPNTHFFTRDRAECHIVNKTAQWSLEGLPFFATEPRSDGTCPAPFAQTRIPLYRVWRPFGDSNHRFTTERAVVNEMVSKGWIDEGVAMCVLPPA